MGSCTRKLFEQGQLEVEKMTGVIGNGMKNFRQAFNLNG